MIPRFNAFKVSPDLTKALMGVEAALADSGLEHGLAELVRLRASQINGCSFCLHMHVADAKAHGETELRMIMLDGWRESSMFSERERAALAWTESLTRIAKTHAPDADYEQVKSQFSESEIVSLTILIGQINSWNRVQIASRVTHPVEAAKAA
ncbi:MAG: carboxymuconolactone decarboxylase family protein [Alphaproteobacteria bacterium]|nr:carboxymuconolactone decarboxylase family protein [Alphaproteobacteria bacterium]MBU1516593.1 carboxymuconolactone decarboxylase family protein [Alphaproteobacteria bacterium]MBU2094350.1 carboxymuconolactone decarboxylase family protein [Alphaproteobacteria bacterium]MBU2153234.1 carboxymuconolactone decarboxylase family protein [Alphaproteobacteria bacterium]MBU2307520.1 carboxymuconolactone decarboxylase family protein [Alphaproteobacteria bacterium]